MPKSTPSESAKWFSTVGPPLNEYAWPACSWLVAGYFVWALHLHVGFPPGMPLTPTAATYLMLAVMFIVLPYAQRLKVGKLIEFEAKMEQVQADVKEVRTETRELVTTASALATVISVNANQNVVVNVPSVEDAKVARSELLSAAAHSPEPDNQERTMLEYMGAGDSDVHYALARLRMDLERQLRRVLGKRMESDDPTKMRGRFLSARFLFRKLAAARPRYLQMQASFNYLLEVCNAAIHGQRVRQDVVYEAMDMGLRLLRELESEEVLSPDASVLSDK